METTQKDIMYYESRLKLVRDLYLKGENEILLENMDKINRLVRQYKEFPRHDPVLADFPENFLGVI